MIKLVVFLITVRLRKLVSKGDHLANILLMLIPISVAALYYFNVEKMKPYVFILFLDMIFYHLSRADIELLKLRKNYKSLIILEYTLYNLPYYVVLLLTANYYALAGFIALSILIVRLPKSAGFTMSYPFDLLNPFWHINFRKYKLVLVYPVCLLFLFLSNKHGNENLTYFAMLLLAIICCGPSFEKERHEELKLSPIKSSDYLYLQMRNCLVNSAIIVVPILVLMAFIIPWQTILFSLVLFIFPFLGILFKYVYFDNEFLQKLSFMFFAVATIMLYGLPLLAVPLLYKKSITNLDTIKYD